MRTMGVDQVASGLEVSVVEWTDSGSRTQLLDAVVRGGASETLRAVLVIQQMFGVERGCVDPSPDQRAAAAIIGTAPEVFAAQAGSEHNAASLAEVAWRRARTGGGVVVLPDVSRVVTLEPDFLDPTRVVARVYVKPGEALPSHLVLDLAAADVMVRGDGGSVVEKVLPLAEVGMAVATDVPPQFGYPRQVWALAPTTKLPPQGWSLVLSVYANGVLAHEQVVTENQMMGLGALAEELARDVVRWVEMDAPNHLSSPWTANFQVYAGQASVHSLDVPAQSDPMLLAAALEPHAVDARDWIYANAVAMEKQYPAVNLPAQGPFDVPDISTDAYDYQN